MLRPLSGWGETSPGGMSKSAGSVTTRKVSMSFLNRWAYDPKTEEGGISGAVAPSADGLLLMKLSHSLIVSGLIER